MVHLNTNLSGCHLPGTESRTVTFVRNIKTKKRDLKIEKKKMRITMESRNGMKIGFAAAYQQAGQLSIHLF